MSRLLCCCLLLLASPAAAEFLVQEGDYYERLTGLDTRDSIRITGGRVDVLEVGGSIGLTIEGGSIGELQSTGNAVVTLRTGEFQIDSPIHLTDVFEVTFDGYTFEESWTEDRFFGSGWFADFTYGEFEVESGRRWFGRDWIFREHPPGDAQGDGAVDIQDLNYMRNDFGNDDNPIFDTNGDGRVDLDDVNGVRNNFGAVYDAPSNSVPEPATLGLLLAGMTALLLRRLSRCNASPA